MATITVEPAEGALGEVSVDYLITNGTAIGGTACMPGVDYLSTGGTLSFADGVTSRNFTIPICNDAVAETTETVNLTLSNPTGGASLGTKDTAQLNIIRLEEFSNTTPILIPASGPAGTYPSTIDVSGLKGVISELSITLNNLQHAYSSDLDMMLVGPSGQRFNFLSEIGDESGFTEPTTITLSDFSATALPATDTAVISATYKPAAYAADAVFPPPAPAGSYAFAAPAGSATFASLFGNSNPNGTWSLYVVDDSEGDEGSISGGWALSIATTSAPSTIRITSITRMGNTVTLQGTGLPNTDYAVQASSELALPFDTTSIGTVRTDSSGLFQFTDNTALPRRFYRLVDP
jgi:subtilisin-like proprotein convertase family protein